MRLYTAASIFTYFLLARCQSGDDAPPSTFPHIYPGKPKGDFSPAYQSYYEVTDPLPNVTFDVGRMFAGNLPVQRAGHPNDTFFFWAFEKQNGSLTAAANASTDPWGIWLNGGPGSSSMYGALFENGPIRINSDYTISQNNFSWSKVADYIWIDQPVGVGFSTADTNGYIDNEETMAKDFFGFLSNLVKVFPGLATRPLHLTGESYAGTYIPYILKEYFSLANPPVTIAAIAIGDGSIATEQVFELLPALTVIETYPQIIGYDTEVFEYFKEQSHLCGYDLNLTYPQNGTFPPIPVVQPIQRTIPFLQSTRFHSNQVMQAKRDVPSRRSIISSKRALKDEIQRRYKEDGVNAGTSIQKRDREMKRMAWKRDLTGRANGTIDPWYGCFLFDEFMDYAKNFTFPWSENDDPNDIGFGIYDVPDALSPAARRDASVFLNDKRTRAALHAPTSFDWVLTFPFPFGELTFDPSPEPMVFLTDLATNATAKNVSVILFSGNDDALVSHLGTEITIQNTTFGGIQGFTRKPSTPWHDDSGNFAGIIRQERGWTYVLFDGAGHMVPVKKPQAAFTFAREFIFGNNQTGLVESSSVVGGEDPALTAGVLPGQKEIYVGKVTTSSTFVFPSATIAAWDSFMAAQTSPPALKATASNNAAPTSRIPPSLSVWVGLASLGLLFVL
ncbi:Carboxypeptidase [Pleurotus pulmonarius]